MRILVTNDDGIYSEGLWALARAVAPAGEVVVAAPDREQSAVGTSVTLHHLIRVREVEPPPGAGPVAEAYAIEGTPADSVILALGHLLKQKPDLLVSGINQGANLGNDVLISGTVGAALQGYFLGIPSLAFSVTALEEVRYEAAVKLAGLLARKFAEGALDSQPILLNVNLPNLPPDEIKGIRLTRLAGRAYADDIKEGYDGKRKYYWIVRGRPEWKEEEGTDIWAIRHQMVSIVPLHSNLTSPHPPAGLEGVCAGLMAEFGAAPAP